MQARSDAAIACTLPSGVLQSRLHWIRRVTAEGLIAHRIDGTTLRLTYRPEVRADLEQIVAEEQKCCAFLRFTLTAADDAVLLGIEAPGGLGEEARWLFDHFLPQPLHVSARQRCGCAPGTCG
jgi:hypothetical protein